MTFKELKEILKKNKIPDDVILMSNSGWECGATDIDDVYYSASKNEIHLTQAVLDDGYEYNEDMLMKESEKAHDWILLK